MLRFSCNSFCGLYYYRGTKLLEGYLVQIGIVRPMSLNNVLQLLRISNGVVDDALT
jgi:hypothetical protein